VKHGGPRQPLDQDNARPCLCGGDGRHQGEPPRGPPREGLAHQCQALGDVVGVPPAPVLVGQERPLDRKLLG